MTDIAYKVIAHIHTDLTTKFGVPRQSRVAKSLTGKIVFEPEFRNADAVRGLNEFSHLWVVWDFSLAHREDWSPMVRPPRLGGNTRLGVFATRSPFRPNPIGLSAFEIDHIDFDTELAPVIHVKGVDMVDGTPIIDIKPYIPYADAIPDAKGGFTDSSDFRRLSVKVADNVASPFDNDKLATLTEILENDPRPQYHDDPHRVYGMEFADHDIRFQIDADLLTITEITPLSK